MENLENRTPQHNGGSTGAPRYRNSSSTGPPRRGYGRYPGLIVILLMVIGVLIGIIKLRMAPGRPEQEMPGPYGDSHSLQEITTKNGNVTRTDYVNDQGELTYAVDRHYATVTRTVKGYTILIEFFGTDGKPALQPAGHCGVLWEYDDHWQNAKITYLNADGEPTPTIKGYTTVIRTYNDDKTAETDYYYDADGEPVRLSEGQYGVYREDGKERYLDADGNEIFNLRLFLHSSPGMVILFGVLLVAVSLICGRKINILLLIAYLAFIVYMTLMHRETAESSIIPELFWSYKQFFTDPEIRWEILYNIFLFIPLGTMLGRVFRRWQVVFLPIVIAVGIEVMQYCMGTGICEIDDVISNGIGGLIGYGIGRVIGSKERSDPKRDLTKRDT